MNKIFRPQTLSPVPDGTLLSRLLNANDSQSDLSLDLPDCFSISAGTIKPKTSSKIHVMPFITMATFVRSGSLTLKMKGPGDPKPYQQTLTAGQAALTEPGTFIQLINDNEKPCKTLYISSPAYVYEENRNRSVRYDDSLVLDEGWKTLAKAGWLPSRPMPTRAQRKKSKKRLAQS